MNNSKAIIVDNFDLDKVLREIGQGYSAVIKRKEPTWCDGIIDTIELDPDEPISMDFLKREYGGRKLQITIQDAEKKYVTARTVKFPDPPRYEGRLLIREVEGQPAPGQQSGANVLGEVKGIFELMLTSQEKQMDGLVKTMEKRLESLERTQNAPVYGPAQPQQPAHSPTNQLKQSFAMIKQIEELKGEMGMGAPEQEQDNSITRAVDKFTDLMIEKEQAKIKAQMDAAEQHQQGAPALPAASTYTPPQQPQQPRGDNVSGIFSNLSDIEFAAHVKNRLESLDPEDRDRAISTFVEMYEPEEEEEEEIETSEESESDLSSGSVKVIDDGEESGQSA